MQEGCRECRAAQGPAILDAVYRLGADEARAIRETGRARFWDHHPLLPVPDREGMVTLGEGNSPLLSLPQAAEDILRISGICVEPSSAAALACLRALGREGNGLAGKSAVLIATGTGLRWPATFDGISNRPPIVAPSISALRAVVEI